MASSSRGSEGAGKVTNEISEDLVLLWTRDATTIYTSGTFVENDRQVLEELIQCVHKEKDSNATKQKLSILFGTGEDRKSVVIRARVLSRLIAIALGLHPDDITIDSGTGKESLRPSVDFQTALRPRLAEALQDDDSVLSYLLKDALEADDEVMTVIFCDPRFFEKYPVPYFHGCDLAVVQEISKLWLSQEFRSGFYFCTVLEPVVNQVKVKQSKVAVRPPESLQKTTEIVVSETPAKDHRFSEMNKAALSEERLRMATILDEDLLNATMMFCELLQRRSVKAGARLLEVMLSFRNDATDRVRELVKGLVTPLIRFKNGNFRNCLFQDFQNWGQEEWWHLQGSDQVLGPFGQSIIVGPSSAQTDSNLLCWAARRGYSNLIWCISLGYTEARQMSSNENLLDDATQALGINLLWKVALWCATRQGKGSGIMQLTCPSWVRSIDFNDYTGIQWCLPPLHLVSLLGDRSLLRILRIGKVGIESGAHKTDYLGKTPLDYAMQFQLSTKNSKEGKHFQFITNDIKDRMQFQSFNNEFKKWSHLQAMPRYSTLMTHITPSYKQRRPKLASGHQSCVQELLQMSGVTNRLKELNDMYITQANFVLISAALIASVAFSGWLQPPLGYTDYFQFIPASPLAPGGTYEQYIAVEGHLSVQMFVAFNALSFFGGIGTMMIGAVATLFFHDNNERSLALMKVQKSIKWMLGFFITSMVCIMAAFICAGLAILPPLQRLEWSMIVSLCLGVCICLVPLIWILFSLARDQIARLKDKMIKLILQFEKEKKSNDSFKSLDDSINDLGGPLLNEEYMKTLEVEMERKFQDEKEKRLQEENEKILQEEKDDSEYTIACQRNKRTSTHHLLRGPKMMQGLKMNLMVDEFLDNGPLEFGRSLFSMY